MLPANFYWSDYIEANPDLSINGIDTKEKAIEHYVKHGQYENRELYSFSNMYNDKSKINYSFYIRTCDIEFIDDYVKVLKHYEEFGNSLYDKKMHIVKSLNIEYELYDYFFELDNFAEIYYPMQSIEHVYYLITTEPKIEFRYFCYRYLKYIRHRKLPEISINAKKEAVLLEFRNFSHIEFIIRNNIHKLEEGWSHTVVCGLDNYDLVYKICQSISSHIKIIKLQYANLDVNSYNNLLTSAFFWNLFVGDKILIYQEDSCIFRKGINKFLQYDYIGAPWPKHQNDNIILVGNGGFSLRTKSIMLKIIDTISLQNTTFNSDTLQYMKNVNLKNGPEDVYFSKNMLDLHIGTVASYEIASEFSIETIYHSYPFAGHNFWFSNNKWKKLLYDNIVKQFNPHKKLLHFIKIIEHRGGWKKIINFLIAHDFYSLESNGIYNFIDLSEAYCWLNSYFQNDNKKIVCIVHGTIKKRNNLKQVENFDWCNIDTLINTEQWKNFQTNVIKTYTCSNFVAKYLQSQLQREVLTIKHPINLNVVQFDYVKFVMNKEKYIIQIGQQFRYFDAIYKIQTIGYKKMFLPGSKSLIRILSQQKEFENIEIKYLENYNEYDELMSQNIVLCHLIDANANNLVLECIVRNTPLFINKHPAVIEYLGENYPLYFNDLEEIDNILLDDRKIYETYKYLKNMNKKDLTFSSFMSNLIE